MIELPRLRADQTVSSEIGGYRPTVDDMRPGLTAALWLPCGHELTLGDKHIIRDSGRVQPKVVCASRHKGTGQLCNFNDTVQLKDWTL